MKLDPLTLKFLSSGTPESSKRLIAYRSARVLAGVLIALTTAIVWQALLCREVSGVLITAFISVVGFVAALAREIYRKPDDKDGQ